MRYYYAVKLRSQISAAYLEKKVNKRRGANSRKFGTFPRQLWKPSTSSQVCMTVKNSPNPSSVYIRLCKHRKKVFFRFHKITFPRKRKNSLFRLLIKREILTSREVLYMKLKVFRYSFSQAILIFFNPFKGDFVLV